jgi:hypothetical protein
VRRTVRPAVVICLAMVLVVGLVAGLTALVSALVVPTWTFAALVAVRAARRPEPVFALVAGPILSSTGLRAPPALARL